MKIVGAFRHGARNRCIVSPAKAGAQSGDADNRAKHAARATSATGPRPSPGKRPLSTSISCRAAVSLGAALILSGCGAASDLKPAKGEALPVAPYGARATPTPAQLLTPADQARPQRSDELLTQSEKRRSDEFDLPPPN